MKTKAGAGCPGLGCSVGGSFPVDGISVCNKEAFPATPKVCLVFAKIVSPLREKPILFPDPGSRVPYCQQSGPPLPRLGAFRRTTRRGGRFFQTVIVKPQFRGLGRENQALVFLGCNPDPPKENLGGKTATSPTSPPVHTQYCCPSLVLAFQSSSKWHRTIFSTNTCPQEGEFRASRPD